MAKPRQEKPEGGVYHLYARGNDRCCIFRDVADRELYLRTLADVKERFGWMVLEYCLMDNHLHLIVETREGNLGDGMRVLQGRYAMAFNRRHGRSGHLFQGRYGSTVIEDDGHLCMAIRYVALNPPTAGLCARPQDWEWSSCRGNLEGNGPKWLDRDRVLQAFDWLGGDPCERYAHMIAPATAPAPASVAAGTLHEASRERDGRELVSGHAGEEPRFDLRDESGQLLPLGDGQVAAPPLSAPDQLDQPPPLLPVEPPDVVAGEDGDLRDRDQLEHRQPPQTGQPGDHAGDEASGHDHELPDRAANHASREGPAP
jgi:REP element-mobilizing transposase RayT